MKASEIQKPSCFMLRYRQPMSDDLFHSLEVSILKLALATNTD